MTLSRVLRLFAALGDLRGLSNTRFHRRQFRQSQIALVGTGPGFDFTAFVDENYPYA